MPRKKDKSIVVRFNENEMERVKGNIAKSNLTQQEYCQRALLGKKITVIEGVRELTVQLGKIGGNINQIAKGVNSGMITDCTRQLEYISRELKDVWQLLRLTLSGNQQAKP